MYRYQFRQGRQDFDNSRRIRTDVFVEEQGFREEFDDIDGIAWHVVVFDGDRPIATGRTFPNADGSYSIGRVAVIKGYRSKGVGAVVMNALEEKARALGARTLVLSAQTHAVGFYQRMGFSPYGEEYYDEHCPHIAMKKDLL